MSSRLEGETAVVTGAGSGIGRVTALRFLDEGANVVAGVFAPAEADSLEATDRLAVVQADVSQESGARSLIETALQRFGRVDVLANVAGIVESANAIETTEDSWHRQLDVNLKGVWLCSKFAVEQMLKQGGGSIVNVASINAIRGNHRLVAYSASKGGVAAVTRAMALDHAPDNIRVNCVCPATIDQTGQVDQSFRQADDPETLRRYLLDKHPMGRLGKPEEVAAAILFFASDEASFITGTELPIDGGRSIR